MPDEIQIVIPTGMSAAQKLAAAYALEDEAINFDGWLVTDAINQIRAWAGEELEKAVIPHRAHIQQRSRGGRFIRFNWRREQPRGTSGQFVSRLTKEEREQAKENANEIRENFQEKLDWLWQDVNREAIGAGEAARRGGKVVAEYYTQIFRTGMQAAGNPAIILSARDKAVISRIARDEADYWSGFMADIANGSGRVPYATRAAMYGNAGQEAYWLGFVLGNVSPRRRLIWTLGETEHCETCLGMADHGPWTVEDFIHGPLVKGYLPQSGYLDCLGIRCQCKLTDNLK